jgi:hypothetical protein
MITTSMEFTMEMPLVMLRMLMLMLSTTPPFRFWFAFARRSWLFLCEKMYDEAIQVAIKKSSRSSVDMVRPSLDLGVSPSDPSTAFLIAKSGISSATLDQGQVSIWKAVKAKGLVEGLKYVRAKRISAKAKALKIDGPGDAKSSHIVKDTEYPMWTKKESGEGESNEYVIGRDQAGAEFVKAFSEMNPWAVAQFDYGLNPEHGKKMGLAMELIVSGATRPQKLNQRLRVLALGHVQMGIKPEMFPHFEKTLFGYLQKVTNALRFSLRPVCRAIVLVAARGLPPPPPASLRRR